jgi:hypothetical protein
MPIITVMSRASSLIDSSVDLDDRMATKRSSVQHPWSAIFLPSQNPNAPDSELDSGPFQPTIENRAHLFSGVWWRPVSSGFASHSIAVSKKTRSANSTLRAACVSPLYLSEHPDRGPDLHVSLASLAFKCQRSRDMICICTRSLRFSAIHSSCRSQGVPVVSIFTMDTPEHSPPNKSKVSSSITALNRSAQRKPY